jgi:hypothetical protein
MSFRNALSGDYEILGDDVDFIGDDALMLGEEMSVDPSVRQQAAAKILGRNALLLKETKPTKSRVFPLGFESQAHEVARVPARLRERWPDRARRVGRHRLASPGALPR